MTSSKSFADLVCSVDFVDEFSCDKETGALAGPIAGGGGPMLLIGIVEVTGGRFVSMVTAGWTNAGGIHMIFFEPSVAFSNRSGGGPMSGR